MINVSFIREVTLSSSAFGAEYDNPLSGVLSFEQKRVIQINLEEISDFGASEAGLTLEGLYLEKIILNLLKLLFYYLQGEVIYNFYLN